jgi:hypothetical protein
MKERIILSLKTAWLTSAIAVLFMGTNLCVSTDESCVNAGETMLLLMFWLTFPTGIVSLLVSLTLIAGEKMHYPSDYITVWSVMFCAGCVQWFVLVPRIFAKPRFTVLELGVQVPRQPSIPNIRSADVGDSEAGSKQLSKSHVARVRPVKRRRQSNDSIVAFDKRGRSPLERAMGPQL